MLSRPAMFEIGGPETVECLVLVLSLPVEQQPGQWLRSHLITWSGTTKATCTCTIMHAYLLLDSLSRIRAVSRNPRKRV